jgi:hypothetical protein
LFDIVERSTCAYVFAKAALSMLIPLMPLYAKTLSVIVAVASVFDGTRAARGAQRTCASATNVRRLVASTSVDVSSNPMAAKSNRRGFERIEPSGGEWY